MTITQGTGNSHIYLRLLEVCKNSTAALDFEPLLTVFIDTAAEVTASEWAQVLIYDTEKSVFRMKAAPFYLREEMEKAEIPLKDSLAGRALVTLTPAVYHSAQKLELADTVWEKQQKAASVLAVPIVYCGEALGVLEAFNKAYGADYNEQDVFALEVLAAQAAEALRNQELIEKNDQAMQKMLELDSLKSDFIAIASHELRTPLGLIMGHASFINETANEVQKADVEVISRSAARMKDIIDDFGDMDTITNGMKILKRERVLFDAMVPELVELFQPMARERKVRLTHEIKGTNLSVEGDTKKLELVLRNLIKNGLNYTNPGGVVKVTAEAVPGYIKVSVIDSGIGIPTGELKKIFNRFYQVEKHLTRKHAGMGIGLSSAKEMAEMHGGKILVDSIEDKGSRFTVLIPLNAAQASAAQRVFLE